MTFKCAVCKEIFNKGLTEEEAEKQLEVEFPGTITEECDLVCDDCFKLMGEHISRMKNIQKLHEEFVDMLSKKVAEEVDKEIMKKIK